MNDVLKQLARDLKAEKLRTFLTIFGIVWGTVAISLMLAFGTAGCTSSSSNRRPASATAS